VTDVVPTPTATREQWHDPDALQKDLDTAKEMTAGPVPLIPSSVDPIFELPRGIMHNGTWQTKTVVRELNGMDEEAMSRVKEPAEVYDIVLALATVRIGELDLESLPLPERQGHLHQLLIGERDLLYLAIIKATYGSRKELRYRCQNPECNEEQDLFLDLDADFAPRQVDDIQRTEFTYTTSKGDVISYRAAIGSDQLESLKRRTATMAEQNTILLSRCIKEVNGRLVVDPMDYARRMPMRDRLALLGELVERQPTFDLSVTIECVACRQEQVIPLGWGDLFRP